MKKQEAVYTAFHTRVKLHTENELVEEVTVDMDLPLLANSRQINTPAGKMLAKTITAVSYTHLIMNNSSMC